MMRRAMMRRACRMLRIYSTGKGRRHSALS
jgi:hypothetical protein